MDPLRLTLDVEYPGGVRITFLSPNREQKIRARRILRRAQEVPDDVAAAEAMSDTMEDEIEQLLSEMVARLARDGSDSVSGEPAQQKAVELGFLRGPDGGLLFREVCFRSWAQAPGDGSGGSGGAE